MPEELSSVDVASIEEHVTVAHPDADSIQFVGVQDEGEVVMYLWNTDDDELVAPVVGFDSEGIDKLQDWLVDIDVEAHQGLDGYGSNTDQTE